MQQDFGFYFCICPDALLAKEHVEKLLSAATPKGGHWKRVVFWADEPLTDRFWAEFANQSLFGEGKVLVLRNAHLLLTGDWQRLGTALARPNSLLRPIIFLESEFDKGKPKIPAPVLKSKAFEFAKTKGWLWQSPRLAGAELKNFVLSELKSLNLSVPGSLMPKLLQALPPDAAAIRLELEKLFLASGPELKEDALELLYTEKEPDVFALLRALQDGANPAAVWGMVFSPSTDKKLFLFLGALVREARVLWQLLFGENVYMPFPALADAKKALAKKIGVRGLATIWQLAVEAETGIKSGLVSEEQAFESLVRDLRGLLV